VGYTNAIILLLKGDDMRFDAPLQDMLRRMSAMFGDRWWQYMTIGVSFWSYTEEDINDREENCEYYPDDCLDETHFCDNVNKALHDKFFLNRTFPCIFADPMSQTKPQLDDMIQQNYWRQETKKLWNIINGANDTFPFLTIDDILEENQFLKEKIVCLDKIINDKISWIEGNMTEHRNDINKNQEDINKNQEDIKKHRNDINKNREDIENGEVRMAEIEEDVMDNKEDIARHDKGVYYCGYRYNTNSKGATITYSHLVTSYHSSGVGSGGLNRYTGVFTAPLRGLYTATWSLVARNSAGESAVEIYLYLNGNRMDRSKHVSYYTGHSGHVSDQGGRSLVLQLAEGDTVKLYCEDCSAMVGQITFCISMEKAT